MTEDLPPTIRERASRLARTARRADDAERVDTLRERRQALLADHGFTSRVREEDNRAVLVCYPEEWVDGGIVQLDQIESLDRAVEIPLTGAGDPDDWPALAEANREIAERVRARLGDDHGENAAAFATFMNNHRAKHLRESTPEDVEEFLEEYFPRNAWPSAAQRALVEQSVEYTIEEARSESGP